MSYQNDKILIFLIKNIYDDYSKQNRDYKKFLNQLI